MSSGELIKMIRLGAGKGGSSEMQQTQQPEPLGRIPNSTPTPHKEINHITVKWLMLSEVGASIVFGALKSLRKHSMSVRIRPCAAWSSFCQLPPKYA